MKILNTAPSLGEMIHELYLTPTQLSIEEAAALCQIDSALFNKIVNDQHRIGYELAYRLGKGFNTSHQFWLNLQQDYLKSQAMVEQEQ